MKRRRTKKAEPASSDRTATQDHVNDDICVALRSSSNPIFGGTIPNSVSLGSLRSSSIPKLSSHISDISEQDTIDDIVGVESDMIRRKPIPYGKPSLELLRRTVSFANASNPGSRSEGKLSPHTPSEQNTSMITTNSYVTSDLEVCQSKEFVTVESSSTDTSANTDYDDLTE